MKKKVSLFVASILAIVALPAAVFAAPSSTIVSGFVTYNGNGVNDANVVVVCNSYQMTTTTGSNGGYSVSFPVAQCPDNTQAHVTATSGDRGGVNSGKTSYFAAYNVNIAIVNVSLPEFGIIAGIGAALAGGVAFLVIRRHQLSDHKT